MANMPDTILIITGGIFQIPAIEEAKKMGLKTIVTDGNPQAPCMRLADESYPIDIFDVNAHLKLVNSLKKKNNIIGVFTEGSEATVTVATLAKKLNLPGISILAAKSCKNKSQSRKILQKNSLPIPKWTEISNKGELKNAIKKIGFPLIIKAGDNSASRGSTKLRDAYGIEEAFELAKKNSSNNRIILEELCFGKEQSVEILFDEKGKCIPLNIVDRYFTKNQWSVELGHVNPSRLRRQEKKELFSLTESAAKSFGIRFGVFKADTMITKKGPIILEVTPRLSGGFDSQKSTPISTGRNFIRAAIRLAIQLPLDKKDLKPKWKKYCAVWTILAKPGRVKKIICMDSVKKMKGFKEFIFVKNEGDIITEIKDSASRPAYVITEGKNYSEALRLAKKAAKKITYEMSEIKP